MYVPSIYPLFLCSALLCRAYMESQVTSDLTFLPAWLADLIANYGLDIALDLLADLEAPSTPQHFYQELQGLADATGVDYKTLLRIHLIGELTQGDCSMYGAWGAATVGGKTLATRALDWDTVSRGGRHWHWQAAHARATGAHVALAVTRRVYAFVVIISAGHPRRPAPDSLRLPPHRGPRLR